MRPSRAPIKGLTRVLGVDVAKASVVLFDSQTRRTWTVTNKAEALRTALAPFADYELMVCEVTGGYERALLEAALDLGLPAHRADPLRVKRYIASLGGAAKTDGIDAAWLSRYGQERGAELARWRAADLQHDALASLVRHRQHLTGARAEAKNRRSAPACQAIEAFLDEEIAFLSQQILRLDQAIADWLEQAPELAQREQRLRDITGFGPVVARSLLAFMPELGTLNRRQAASLAGLAPHPRDSGQLSARRRSGHGRDNLRPVLFMAALTAARANTDLKAFAERLASAGKPKRLILTAVARKLVVIANARIAQTSSQLT
jgi:transposase